MGAPPDQKSRSGMQKSRSSSRAACRRSMAQVIALRDVDLDIWEANSSVLLGPSGSGKSTSSTSSAASTLPVLQSHSKTDGPGKCRTCGGDSRGPHAEACRSGAPAQITSIAAFRRRLRKCQFSRDPIHAKSASEFKPAVLPGIIQFRPFDPMPKKLIPFNEPSLMRAEAADRR